MNEVSLVPDEKENIINDPVAFLEFMMPELKIESWQKEILRNIEDSRWQELMMRYR